MELMDLLPYCIVMKVIYFCLYSTLLVHSSNKHTCLRGKKDFLDFKDLIIENCHILGNIVKWLTVLTSKMFSLIDTV